MTAILGSFFVVGQGLTYNRIYNAAMSEGEKKHNYFNSSWFFFFIIPLTIACPQSRFHCNNSDGVDDEDNDGNTILGSRVGSHVVEGQDYLERNWSCRESDQTGLIKFSLSIHCCLPSILKENQGLNS